MISSPFAITENRSFRYIDSDPESNDVAVLLLHGMLGSVWNWELTVRTLSDAGYRVLVPVLPIYTIEISRATLDGLTDYVKGFLDELGIRRCIIAGNSLGGHLALRFAIHDSDRTRGLVLSGASGIYEIDLGRSIMRRRDRAYLRERAEKTFFDPAMCTDELMDDVIRIINTPAYVKRLISITRSIQNGSVRDMLPEIKCPTLLIWGREDQVTPLHVAETFHDRISRADLQIIDRCGHAPMMERPEHFNSHLLGFLERHASADTHAAASSLIANG